jgi:hypothetical protein
MIRVRTEILAAVRREKRAYSAAQNAAHNVGIFLHHYELEEDGMNIIEGYVVEAYPKGHPVPAGGACLARHNGRKWVNYPLPEWVV